MNNIKTLIYVSIGIFLTLTILIEFSTVTSTYKCTSDDTEHKVFIRLETYVIVPLTNPKISLGKSSG